MALEAGALARGQWSGRHSTPISNEWPDFADRKRTDKSNRLSYPFGVMLNRSGRRFVDEGEDLGLYTYAKYGGEILRQPGSLAWQIFDSKTMHLLEPRYRTSDPITDQHTPRGAGRAARDRRPAPGAPHPRGVQRGGVRPRRLRSDLPRRARDGGNRSPQVELGAPARRSAVRRLLGHRRDHLHVRGARDRRARPGARHGLASDSGALHLRRDGRRAFPLQLPGRNRTRVRSGVRPHRGGGPRRGTTGAPEGRRPDGRGRHPQADGRRRRPRPGSGSGTEGGPKGVRRESNRLIRRPAGTKLRAQAGSAPSGAPCARRGEAASREERMAALPARRRAREVGGSPTFCLWTVRAEERGSENDVVPGAADL